jgi:hypothetical protein
MAFRYGSDVIRAVVVRMVGDGTIAELERKAGLGIGTLQKFVHEHFRGGIGLDTFFAAAVAAGWDRNRLVCEMEDVENG